jgi:sulfur carrier protein ThiS
MGQVRVTTMGLLRATLPEGIVVESGQTVAQAVAALGFGSNEGIIPLVNGVLAAWSTVLRDGDWLDLVQSVGGGA